ncbi:LOW QUALITY PROTEIN: hypothetical protein U0070_011119 [Myodes glareolus]|uniref:Uncharacterized protein n=1 Tax=Myodes glareolus TaxID=447135 RepID=A0AAW0IBG5_MYOGA
MKMVQIHDVHQPAWSLEHGTDSFGQIALLATIPRNEVEDLLSDSRETPRTLLPIQIFSFILLIVAFSNQQPECDLTGVVDTKGTRCQMAVFHSGALPSTKFNLGFLYNCPLRHYGCCLSPRRSSCQQETARDTAVMTSVLPHSLCNFVMQLDHLRLKRPIEQLQHCQCKIPRCSAARDGSGIVEGHASTFIASLCREEGSVVSYYCVEIDSNRELLADCGYSLRSVKTSSQSTQLSLLPAEVAPNFDGPAPEGQNDFLDVKEEIARKYLFHILAELQEHHKLSRKDCLIIDQRKHHLRDRHCSLVSELTHHFSRKALTRLAKATTRRNELLNQELLSDSLMQTFRNVFDQCSKLVVDIPLVESCVAKCAVCDIILELGNIPYYPTTGERQQFLSSYFVFSSRLQDWEWLAELFQQMKYHVQKTTPGKDHMVEILEGKESRFCFPLLKLKEELLKQIKWNPSTQAIGNDVLCCPAHETLLSVQYLLCNRCTVRLRLAFCLERMAFNKSKTETQSPPPPPLYQIKQWKLFPQPLIVDMMFIQPNSCSQNNFHKDSHDGGSQAL